MRNKKKMTKHLNRIQKHRRPESKNIDPQINNIVPDFKTKRFKNPYNLVAGPGQAPAGNPPRNKIPMVPGPIRPG